MLELGLQYGPFELVSEDNPGSLSFGLGAFGSVFNSCPDCFRKWISWQNDNEVQPQRVPAGTVSEVGKVKALRGSGD